MDKDAHEEFAVGPMDRMGWPRNILKTVKILIKNLLELRRSIPKNVISFLRFI